MNKEEREKIKAMLPRGYARRIFLETKISLATIYDTINGKSSNQVVIDAAIRIAAEEKEKVEKNKTLISSL